MTQAAPQDFTSPPVVAPPPALPQDVTAAPPSPVAAKPTPPKPAVGLDALKSLAPDQMTSAYTSGAWSPVQGELVPVRLTNGSLGTVPATNLQQAIEEYGAEIVHPDVVHHAELEAKYGDTKSTIGATLAGGVRGLSLGASDPIALALAGAVGGDKTKEDLRERLNAYKELHPVASTVGELAGIAAPALLSGGAAAIPEGAGLGLAAAGRLARGLSLAGEGVSAVGRVAEAAGARIAAGMVGEGVESLAVRAAQKAVAKGAAGAAEGAIFGAGQGVSEASLGDPNASGEKVWATIGHDAIMGALTGSLVGGGLGASGEVGRDALASVRAKASPYLKAKAEESAVRALNATKPYQKVIDALPGGERTAGRFMLDRVGMVAGDTVETIAPKTEAVRTKIGEQIGKTLEAADAAGIEAPKVEELARAVRAGTLPRLRTMGITNSGAIRDVEDVIEDMRRFGGVEEVPEIKAPRMPGEPERPAVGKPPPDFRPPKAPTPPPEPTSADIQAIRENLEARGYTKNTALRARNQAFADYRQTVAQQAAEHEQATAAARASHDASVAEWKKDRLTAMDWRAGEFAQRLSEHEGKVADAVAARNAALASNEDARFTFTKLHDFRAYLDDQIKWNTNPMAPANPKVDALKAARGIIEDAIVSAGEGAAKEAGPEFAAKYKALKREYQIARAVDNAAQDAAVRMGANARHSLTDKLFAGHGMMAGALMHGPMGAAMGLAAGQASKVVRERGNATLAVWFDKLSTLQAIARRTDDVDAKLAKGVNALVKRASGEEVEAEAASTPRAGAKARVGTVSKKADEDPHEQYAARIAQLEAAQKSPGFDPLSKDLAQHAPQTSAVVAQRAANATAWLSAQVPKPPKFGSPTPSDQDVFEFNEKFDAVAHPADTLAEGMATGSLTTTQVDAVKATAPTIYDQVQKDLESKLRISLATHQTVPYEVRRDIALLFGIDADWSQTPEGAKTLQDNATAPMGKPDGQGAQGGGGPKRGAVSTPSATLMQSDTERRQGGQIR